MERIGELWTNDIHKAYREIESLKNSNPTSFFQSAEMCRRYVQFVERLQIDSIPLEERPNYVISCFSKFAHLLWESAKSQPQNEAFRFMVHADYIGKLKREYPMVCTLLEKEPPIPEKPSGPRVVMVSSKEEWDEQRRRFAERSARKNRLLTLKRYKFILEYDLETQVRSWFDGELRKEQINSFPEPQRTELINYIEEKIGRKMKWRE